MPNQTHPSKETIEAVAQMQQQCIEAYLTVTASLRAGISEAEIANTIIEELRGRGVSRFWYDIPVVVLIGPVRFMQMVEPDYAIKNPSAEVHLQEGLPLFIDIHPQHASGQWGNFAATSLFEPQDQESVSFLKLMQQIQGEGIAALMSDMTGAEVAQWFQQRFQAEQIELVDVRGNFGHNMLQGPKVDTNGKDKRSFLDEHTQTPIGGYIWGIEPGGIRKRGSGDFLIARFEDCVYVPPEEGSPVLLGRQEPVPVTQK